MRGGHAREWLVSTSPVDGIAGTVPLSSGRGFGNGGRDGDRGSDGLGDHSASDGNRIVERRGCRRGGDHLGDPVSPDTVGGFGGRIPGCGRGGVSGDSAQPPGGSVHPGGLLRSVSGSGAGHPDGVVPFRVLDPSRIRLCFRLFCPAAGSGACPGRFLDGYGNDHLVGGGRPGLFRSAAHLCHFAFQ